MSMERSAESLTVERIKMARETLIAAAFYPGFRGAIQAEDPQGNLIEAKRNLTALVQVIYGVEAWQAMLEEDL